MPIKIDDQPESLKLYVLDQSARWKVERLSEHGLILKRFYRWMAARRYALDSLTVEQLNEYTKTLLEKRVAAQTRRRLLLALDRHLAWAYKNGHCRVNPMEIPSPVVKPKNPNLNVTLPKIAEKYLASLVTHKKPSTCKSNKTSIRHLHHFVAATGLELATFGAREMNLFHEYLVARGNTACVRCTRMVEARVYLRWLYEQRAMVNDPDVTLRRMPLPRIPEALPRPLSPEMDRHFEEAFLASTDTVTRGFYVMRHTGLRIGELRQLPFDCMRIDLA